MFLSQTTQNQKKIIIAALIAVVTFLIFWSMIYLPSKKRVSQLKAELAAKEEEIADIQMMAGQDGSLEQRMTLLKERLLKLEEKFPAQEEEALQKISDFARQLKITLISIKPSQREAVILSGREPLAIDQRVCQSISVVADMRCTYAELVEYMKLLRDELPALAIVENLELSRDNATQPGALRVKLGFKIYLLS